MLHRKETSRAGKDQTASIHTELVTVSYTVRRLKDVWHLVRCFPGSDVTGAATH